MEAWKVALLGVLQGFAEFLPISSSGHLVIAEELLGEKLESAALNISLHLGSLVAILVVYYERIRRLLDQPRILWMVVLATLPLVAVGVPLKLLFDMLNEQSLTPFVAACGLLVTAVYMFRSESMASGELNLEQVTPRIALMIGVFQAVAATPGISRSGSTIFAALLMGMSRSSAADFSFLIAIPAILGASVLYGKDILESGSTGIHPILLLFGAVISFVIGVMALKWLLRTVVRGSLRRFAWYCLTLGIVCVFWQGTLLLIRDHPPAQEQLVPTVNRPIEVSDSPHSPE